MNLYDRAKSDIERITSNLNEWGKAITFVSPGGTFEATLDETFQPVTAEVIGIHVKHHLAFNAETGKSINGKTAHVAVSEKFLTDLGYPVRNSQGVVSMNGHLVKVKDSTGVQQTYVVEQWYPDETIGLIVCILGDYEEE